MSFSISPAAASPSSDFLPADLPPPPQPTPEAPPPLIIGPAVPLISPPAPPLPPPPSPESFPPAVAPVAADPPLTAPVPDVTPPSLPLLPPSVASPPPSPPLLPPSVASPPPSAAEGSPPAPAAIIPAAPDVSSPPPQESKPLPRHHAPIPMKPSRKPHLPPPELPSVPSSPAKPQAQPLPTLLPPPSPASPPTETSSLGSPPPVSSEPFFAEIPLSPPASTAASPPAEMLNGSLPLTVDGGRQSPSIAGQSSAREYHVSTGIIVGFAIGGVLLLAMVVLSCFVFRGRKKQKLNSGMEKDYYVSQGQNVVTNDVQYNQNVTSTKPHLIAIPSSRSPPGEGGRPGPALQSSLSYSVGTFTYDELTEATNNFSTSNLLGEGGFGYVHKGVLSSGKEIAVKQLKMGSDQGEREFQAELDTISRVHHKHLVTLLGYCITGDSRFLVYEFVSNKTLEFHLHGNEQPVMEWRTRLKIAIGSAKGLAYLHEDCSPTIIHRDIKAANILLDFNFEAKVSDFGLAKFFSDTNSHITHVSTRVVGTFGYLAPEYASSGKLTEKSDVYSYGVMLLELITGRPPISRTDSSMTDGLVDWARHLLNEAISTRNFDKIVDPRLQKNYELDEMASLIECAAACVRHSAWLRPRMSQIVRALEEKEPLTDHGEGNTPGHSKMYSSLDMKRLTTALASQDYESSRVSDNTSDYGLYPSCSSSEAHMTR